jgi:hypothetical protein
MLIVPLFYRYPDDRFNVLQISAATIFLQLTLPEPTGPSSLMCPILFVRYPHSCCVVLA